MAFKDTEKSVKYLSYHQTYANVSIRSSEINGGNLEHGEGKEEKDDQKIFPKERAPVRVYHSLHETAASHMEQE